MKPIILFLCLVALFVSCSEEDGGNAGRNYEIPRFAVYPLSGSGVKRGGDFARNFFPAKSSVGYYVLAPLNFLLPPARAQGQISCIDEANLWNTAPQTMEEAASISPKDLIDAFYAQAIFYDCNVREQAQSFGVGEEEVTVTEDGEEKSVTILTASRIGDDPEKLTQYVSWTDLPESENVRGRMVNKYLQDNGWITKTRVDLEIEDGARTVTSLLHVVAGDRKSYIKAGFRESDPDGEGNFGRHEVWGRYFDTVDSIVVRARAVALANGGLSVELRRCTGASVDTDCSSGGTLVTKHYDGNGEEVSDRNTVFGTDTAADDFYGGKTEDEYFTPKFSIEEK